MASPYLSPLDSAFLFFERPTQPLHVGCVAELEAELDFAELVDALRERIGDLPRFRERPVRALLDLHAPTWEEDPAFSIQSHIHHVAVPRPGGTAELREVVDMLFSAPLPPRRPPWELTYLDGLAGGRSALLWKVHHCMIDGVSGAELIALTTDPPAGEPASGAAAQPPSGNGTQRRGRGVLPRSPAEVGRTLEDFAETLSALALRPSSRLPFHGPLSDQRHLVWTTFPLGDLLAIRGAAGCKVNDVVLAIVTGGLHRYLEGNGVCTADLRLRALVPVNTRRPEERLALGNRVTAMFPLLPIGIADPAERLRLVAREMQRLKERDRGRAAGLLMAAAGSLPVPFQALLGRFTPDWPVFGTVVTNVPGPPERRRMLGRAIEAIHPIVPLFQSMGLEFAVLSYGGSVSITATADARLVPDAGRVADALAESERELREAIVARPDRVAPPERSSPGAVPTAMLMTRHVLTVSPGDSLLHAYRLMRAHRIRHLPVVDEHGRLVGIVTHRDVLAAARSSLAAEAEQARIRLLSRAEVRDVMETHVSTARPDEPAAAAGRRMLRHKIGCLPVTDESGALVGIVTDTDFIRWATESLEAERAASAAGAGDRT